MDADRKPEDEEINDVRREEESRGQRPFDSAAAKSARAQRHAYLEQLNRLLDAGTDQDFRQTFIDRGIEPGTKEFDEIVKLLRDARRRRPRTS